MAKHYYDKAGAFYLKQEKISVRTDVFSQLHNELIMDFLHNHSFATPEEKQSALSSYSAFSTGLRRFMTVKNASDNAEFTLCKLGGADKETLNYYENGRYHGTVDEICSGEKKVFRTTNYTLYGNNYECEYSDLKYLTQEPSAGLNDRTKSTKIYWGEHKSQAEFFKEAKEFVELFTKLAKNSTHSETFYLISKEYGSEKIKNEIKLDIPIAKVSTVLQKFWSGVEKNIVPLMEKTFSFNEKDYLHKEFTGSLNDPTELISSTVYYLMGQRKGVEGFIGLDHANKSYYGGGISYKIVKEIKNAHIFNSDMTDQLSAFAPLTKIHMKMEFERMDQTASPEAQKIAAYVEKIKLNKALPAAQEAQSSPVSQSAKGRHKI